jgi:hypothetical protein
MKNKVLKTILEVLGIYTVIFALLFGSMAFITLELNPLLWSLIARSSFVVISAAFVIWIPVMYNIMLINKQFD